MLITVSIPDEVVNRLHVDSSELSRQVLETLVVQGYRSGLLSPVEARRLLGFETRMEMDAFLKEAGVFLDYSEDDFDREVAMLSQR